MIHHDITIRHQGARIIHIKDHKTPDMFDPFPYLGLKCKQRIDESWANVFREHILTTLPVEKIFSKYDPVFGAPAKELYSMILKTAIEPCKIRRNDG